MSHRNDIQNRIQNYLQKLSVLTSAEKTELLQRLEGMSDQQLKQVEALLSRALERQTDILKKAFAVQPEFAEKLFLFREKEMKHVFAKSVHAQSREVMRHDIQNDIQKN